MNRLIILKHGKKTKFKFLLFLSYFCIVIVAMFTSLKASQWDKRQLGLYICRMVPFYKSRQLVKEKEISNEKLREQVGQIYSQYLQDSGQVDKHNKTVIIPTNACNVNIRDVIGCNKGEKKDQDHEMEN